MDNTSSETSKKSMDRLILWLAIPNIISNISVPLLSLSDTAIAGRLATIEAIGAVAMASMMVNFSYWLWGFLRMATTGFTAQAYGRGDDRAICRQMSVGVLLALLGGGLIIALRPFLYDAFDLLNDGAASLRPEAIAYLRMAYWGAPAALLLYVLNGWFVGIQNTIVPMCTTIVSNVLNILLSIYFVWAWDMGVVGIALGTVVAQYVTVALLLMIALIRYRHYFRGIGWADFYAVGEVFSYIHVAKYLIVRTIMLGSISLYFLRAGTSYGSLTLAANTLLMQLFTMAAYFFDGFAYAGEALTGRFIGARSWGELRLMLRRLFFFGAVVAPFVSVIYFFWAEDLLALLTDKQEVLQEAMQHILWTILIPLVSFVSFLWDGVFVGATKSRPMMMAVLLAWMSFFGLYWGMRHSLGVDALWLAFVTYLLVRSALSTLWGLRMIRTLSSEK